MAKKPGLMNAVNIANELAGLFHGGTQGKKGKESSSKGKSFKDPSAGADDHDNAMESDQDNVGGPDGTKHPTAKVAKKSAYSGEMHSELSGGTKHPSKTKA